MMHLFSDLATILGADRYSQHAICLTNDPLMIFLYTSGDLATWASYMVIGGSLLWKRVAHLTLSPTALWLYGMFIFLCGLSHLCHVVVLFTGVYRLEVLVTAAMAGVSVVTAFVTAKDLFARDTDKQVAVQQ